MNFDYSPTSTEPWHTEPSVWGMQTQEFGGINPEFVVQAGDASIYPPSSNFTQVLPHDRLPTTRPSSQKPRIVSDSALVLGQSHENYDSTSQDLPHGQRYQRTLSLGCQPFSNHQGLEPDLMKSALEVPSITVEASPEDVAGTSSGLGYDGTKPIAYVQVNDPQQYLSRSTYDVPGPQRHSTSSQGQSPNQVHPHIDWAGSQTDGQPLLTDEHVYNQHLALHGQIPNQHPVHASAPDLYSYPNSQIASSSKPDPEYRQDPPNKSDGALQAKNKLKGPGLNKHRSTKAYRNSSTQTDPKKQVHESQPPSRSKSASKIFSAQEVVVHGSCLPVDPVVHTQSMAAPSTSELSSATAQKLPPDCLQAQQLAQNALDCTSTPNFNTVNYSERDPVPYPSPHNPEQPSFNQSILNHWQSSASSNHPSHLDTHTQSRNPPILIAGNEFQPMSVVAVPVPRRSFNFGAFLTPGPPCQTPNIDLPRRPGTSPPQRLSAPSGRCNLIPNTTRRQSEQTWKLYGSQFDRVQLPPVPSCNPRSRSNIREKDPHAPPISIVPRTRTWVQAQDPCEDNCVIATYGPVSTQATDNRPFLIDSYPSQSSVQQPTASSDREGLHVRKPGQSHSSARSSMLRQKQSDQQSHVRQNKSNPDQVHLKPNIQTQSAASTTHREDIKEQINQQPQALSSEGPARTTLSTAGVESFRRKSPTKRRHSHSNPGDTDGAKRRKVADNDPEVINTQTNTLVPFNQYQQQNLPISDHGCVYFDVNTWRGGDAIEQAVQQSNLVGSNFPTQSQDEARRFTVPSQGEPIGAASEETSENLASLEIPQACYYDSGMNRPEGWPPAFQHQDEQTGNFQYLNWNPSSMSLDQASAFNIEVAAEFRGPEQYVTTFDNPERPAPEASTQPLDPKNFEIEQFLANCPKWSMGAVFV
ncbi:unnamed protein product [Rhizoctonia solani]|uniref:Uncharacterized protein n=1 Tax=Rhizoctonia solani TaxID=456999 RepID=A0A8H2XGX5_9AGAM|nr:unnamed protein product [Rhizoctonia solani]